MFASGVKELSSFFARGRVIAVSLHKVGTLHGILAACLSISLGCALILLAPTQVGAQINTATLTGVVSDPSGAILPDAVVTATNSDTGLIRTAKSSGTGEYSMPSLPPGKYQITVFKEGFSRLTQTGIVLEVGQSANVNAALKLSGTTQSIEVAAETLQLETSNSTLGTVIQKQDVVDLPLNGRMFTQLLELAPGTVPVDQSQNNGKQPNFGAGAPTPSVNGQSNRSNLFFIDGIYASNPFFSGFSLSPSIDAIQEFKEQTHADQAEYGQSLGAIVSVVTKAGTNAFHGSLYEFFRNGKLDARNTFSPSKLPYHQNQYGGTFGGPIIKNKLFFFANYEGGRQVQPSPSYYTVPSAAERTGDFSGQSQIIYDPTTYNPVTQTEKAFPGNRIPTNRIDTQMVAFLNGSFSAPNTSLGNFNLLSNTGNTAAQDQGTVRVDYTLSPNDTIFGRYSQGAAQNAQPSALNNVFTTGFNGKNTGLNWIHTQGPSTVIQVTAAYSSLVIPQSIAYPVDEGAVFAASGLGAGFNKFPGGTAGPQLPALNLSAAPGLQGYTGFWNGAGPIGPMSTAQVAGSLSKVIGSHVLKFGASYYKTWAYTNWNGNSDSFSYLATGNAACQLAASNATAKGQCPGGIAASGGDPVASLLLSLPSGANRNLGNSGVALRYATPSAFVEDSWKASSKLTFNYGLRWDYTSPVTEKLNRLPTYNIYTHQYLLSNGDADAPSTLPANVAYSGRNSINQSHWANFSPRFGMAYQVSPKTVIRAGVGRTFDSFALSLQTAQDTRGDWPSGLSQNASSQTVNEFGISLKPDGTPYTGENPFYGPATVPATPFPQSSTFQDVRWQPASSFQWNLEVQQDLGGIGRASVAYVASETEHVTIQVPYNLAAASTNPIKNYPDTIYGSAGSVLSSVGTASYESLQARLSRQFTNGFTYNSTFTYSSSKSPAVCGDFYQSCVQNPYNLRADYGPTSLDIPFIFTFNSLYQLPVGKNRKYLTSGPAAALLGNWQINGIFTARSGLPFNPSSGSDIANQGGGTQRYNIVGDPYGAKTPANYFNASSFVLPASGSFGTAGINSLRGPHYWDADFSVFRDFPFTENSKVQFRAEFFNIFNHPNYANPGCVQCAITSTTGQGNRDVQLALKLLF